MSRPANLIQTDAYNRRQLEMLNPGATTAYCGSRPCLRYARTRYQFSVPRRVVNDSIASSRSVTSLPKCRSSVAPAAGPQDASELCKHTPSAQRSANVFQSGRRTICFKYGTATQKVIRNGRKKLPTVRFNLGLCWRWNSSQPKSGPMPAVLNSVYGQDRKR